MISATHSHKIMFCSSLPPIVLQRFHVTLTFTMKQTTEEDLKTKKAHNPILFSFVNYHRGCNKIPRWMPQVEQEMFTLPGHTSSPRFLVRITLFMSSNYIFTCLVPYCYYSYDFNFKTRFSSSMISFVLQRVRVQFLLIAFTVLCLKQLPQHMMFVTQNSYTTCFASGAETVYTSRASEFIPGLQ